MHFEKFKNYLVNIGGINYLRYSLYLLNFLFLLYTSIIISNCIQIICWNGVARDLLNKNLYLPDSINKIRMFIILSFLILLFNNFINLKKHSNIFSYLTCIFSLAICLFLTNVYNIGYSGLFLLLIPDYLLWLKNNLAKLVFVSACIILFIFYNNNLNTFSVYYQILDEETISTIFLISKIVVSLNIILSIFFIIFLQQKYYNENTTIKKNNLVLEKTAKELEVKNVKLKIASIESEKLAKLQERNRLAREIHDNVGHYLTNIIISIDIMLELKSYRSRNNLVKISNMARNSLDEMRTSVNELKMDITDNDLMEIISKLFDEIKNFTKTKFHLNYNEKIVLTSEQKEFIYRIIQESITNTIKYGDAKNLWVNIYRNNLVLYLKIHDDGMGCNRIQKGNGLLNMEARIKVLRGNIQFCSELKKGFTIECSIPLGDDCFGKNQSFNC